MEILMTLAPVRPGEEQGLREALRAIEQDPAQNSYIRLGDSRSTHFARWVLLHDSDHGQRLLFVANYDGGIEEYLAELTAAGPGMDAVWGACDGYSGRPGLLDFVRRHYLRPRGVYIAFPGLTAEAIRNRVAIREQISGFLDDAGVARLLDGPGLEQLLERIAQLPPSSSLAERAVMGLESVGAQILANAQRWALDQAMPVAEAFSTWRQKKDFSRVYGSCDAEQQRGREREQRIQTAPLGEALIQNQMTTFTTVRPERRARLQVALEGTAVLSRFGWPPGKFADVGTLHWFAWALVDAGRRLIFVSTFDGSWQNYLQDFINKLVWALDALYSNTYGYPAAGMKDVPAFTDYILDHQWPPEVFYSGYPSETVANLLADLQIARGVAPRRRFADIEQWMQLL